MLYYRDPSSKAERVSSWYDVGRRLQVEEPEAEGAVAATAHSEVEPTATSSQSLEAPPPVGFVWGLTL